jgi:thymidine kinase
MENIGLNLILGPMFSGKSTRLIQYIRKYKTLGYSIFCAKPSIDNRYDENHICTHNLEKESCSTFDIDKLDKIFDNQEYQAAKVIMIEEGQFFKNIYTISKRMLDEDHKIIYISALNGDSNRELFGEIYKLLPLASNIKFLKALCMDCKDGSLAMYSKRNSEIKDQIVVASGDVYKAVCYYHYFN